MKKNLVVSVTALLLAPVAHAIPITYSGFDIGSSTLATSPNATAAASAFDAAVAVDSITDFEAVGSPTEFSLSFGSGLSSSRTNNSTCADALCGYNTTLSGEYFALVYGSTATFTFNTPIDAFGAYFTGWQVGNQTIYYTDGSIETLIMQPPGDVDSGGTYFFGFQDAGKSIDAIIYNAQNDIVAIDDVRLSAAVVPVPAAVWLFGSGLLGLVGVARRKKV